MTCRNDCPALKFYSTLLFLSTMYPPGLAQIVTTSIPAPAPITLLTLTTSPPTKTESGVPSPTPTAGSGSDVIPTHIFNYYFLIVAFFVFVFCILFLFFGRQRKRRAALLRSNGQYALARDIEGWRGNWTEFGNWRHGPQGVPSTATARDGILGVGDREGLNERGEAPPPYIHEDKPPSIRQGDGASRVGTVGNNGTEPIELTQMQPNYRRPPGYEENTGTDGGPVTVTRPAAALTTSNRFLSMRRP